MFYNNESTRRELKANDFFIFCWIKMFEQPIFSFNKEAAQKNFFNGTKVDLKISLKLLFQDCKFKEVQ